MALAMVTFGVSQAAQAIKTAGANKKLANSAIPEDISRPETVRVGRWMSEKEFSKIQSGNLVDTYGGGGAVHVAYPANPNAFGKQALPGSLYIEFDVPLNSIKNAGSGWARIVGPNSIESRLLISKGLQPLQYPKIENIIKVGYKDGNIIKFF